MNIIIFSKDRACQLDLLLKSLDPCGEQVDIIYTFSDKYFGYGYEKIFYDYRFAWFWHQEDFKKDLLKYLNDDDEYTMFLVDDDVLINGLPAFNGLIDDNIACLSLRLHPNMDYCYTLNRKQSIPKMQNNTWNWRTSDADYGYPMSLDGHIFRTADILPLLKRLDYSNPNELEAALAKNPINRPLMMCYDKSIIVNNPINRVQDTFQNRCGNVTAEWLNDQFLEGKRIDLTPFLGYENKACHEEIPITLI